MLKTILVVEDCADTRGFMTYLVQSFGYRALEASDGFEAVAKAKQFRPDLILMDLSMPKMDGFEATQIIREFEDLKKLPIVAVTAMNNDEWDRALEAGCDEVVPKPVDFQRLKNAVTRHLARHGH
ncbi:MAG TPA: response regulator [Pyrinomonadaceae bacterium]|jgi:two-component system cell cycle response regulator DivK